MIICKHCGFLDGQHHQRCPISFWRDSHVPDTAETVCLILFVIGALTLLIWGK